MLLVVHDEVISTVQVPSHLRTSSHLQTGRQQMRRPICQHFTQSADRPSADRTVPSGYTLPNLQTGRQQMGCPICQHFAQSSESAYRTRCSQMGHPFCCRDKVFADGPSHLPTGLSGYTVPNLQMGRQQMGRPICQHFSQSADGTSHLPTGLSGYTVPNLQMGRQQMGRPICQHFSQSADGTSHLPTGPSGYIFPNLQMESPICRRAHLATLCPICRWDVSRWDVPSANILPYLPTICPICILDKMFPDGSSRTDCKMGQNVGRWAVPSSDGTHRHMGQNINTTASRRCKTVYEIATTRISKQF